MRLLLLLILVLSFSCTRNSNRSDLIEISLPNDVSSMDPTTCYDTVCYVPFYQVYESLFEIDYLRRPYTLRPLLAEKFPSVSIDRLTYTFKIKRGILYHPSEHLKAGREVTAKDFITQIKRVAFQGSASRGWWLFDGKIKGINDWRDKVGIDLDLFIKTDIQGLSAPDDHTLVIELNSPYPQLLNALSMSFTAPIPEEAVTATKNDLSRTFFGTGPYIITEYHPEQQITMKKNPSYSSSVYPSEGDRYANENGLLKDAGAKLPFVSAVKFKVIEESQTDWLNFMSKRIDMVNLTKDLYPMALTEDGKLRSDLLKDNIQAQMSPTLIYWWLGFNMKDPIVGTNLNLRKAIAHGVNIDRYIQLFTYNIAQKANSIYPPGIPGYSPSAELPYKYDLELAKEYLKKAGYPQGKGLPTLIYDIRGADTRRRQMGEYLQQELSKLGIKIEVRTNTFPGFLEKSRLGKLQIWQGNWALDYPDSENVLQILTTANLPPGSNYYQYSNSEFDKTFGEMRTLENGKRKFELMEKLEGIVNRDLPWSMQYYSRNYILYHKYLKNFRYSDIIYNNVKYLKLEGK